MKMKTLATRAIFALGSLLAVAAFAAQLSPDLALALGIQDPGAFLAMAVLAATHPTLLDVKNTLDPDGKPAKVIEVLSQRNEMLDDMVWLQANELTGHQTTVRTGLPEPTFRKLYGGVQPSKSTTVKVREATAMLEAYAEIDKALADLNGNSAAWRMQEELPFIEGFAQKLARYIVYGNEATEPESFTGLAPRFSTNDTAVALNAENVIADTATPDGTDNTSIWLVGWGPNSVHGIYPKGSQAGLQISDKGQVTIENIDGAGGRMEAYRTHYKWDCGLAVRDWRYVVRVQINAEDLTKDAATGPDLFDLLVQAVELLPDVNSVRPAFYCNRSVRTWLRRQLINKVRNSTLSMENIAGKMVLAFDGIPFRRVDQILNTESGV